MAFRDVVHASTVAKLHNVPWQPHNSLDEDRGDSLRRLYSNNVTSGDNRAVIAPTLNQHTVCVSSLSVQSWIHGTSGDTMHGIDCILKGLRNS